MPEGPELRRSADILQRFVGRRIIRAFRRGGRYTTKEPAGYHDWCADPWVHDARIHAIDVKGKLMWWRLGPEGDPSAQRWYMLCTYGMTGGWTTQALGDVAHPAFTVSFDQHDAETLTFDDQRHFGTIKFVKGDVELMRKLETLGPDMLTNPPDALEFTQRLLRRPTRTLAESLMDQSTVSGIGNYLKAEIAYRARLLPTRQVISLDATEMIALHDASVTIPKLSYEARGAYLRNYVDEGGKPAGEFQYNFAVYGKKLCPSGHDIVHTETADGRTTWWCPFCQH